MPQRSDQFDSIQSFDQIAERFVARIRNGEHPSLEEYKVSHPEYSAEIDELFPTLAELENYDPIPGDNRTPSAAPYQAPSRLGNYLIQREIGRGGMGVVYEAQHETMRRRVALKVLPADSRKPEYETRFLREARAAGQLHHTNIVPVFEVGKCDGVNFYAMQYIHGQNLDAVIEDLKRLQQNKSQTNLTSPRFCSPGDSTIAFTFLSGNFPHANLPHGENADNLTAPASDSSLQPPDRQDTQPINPEFSTIANQADTNRHRVDPQPAETESSSSSQWSQIGERGDSYYRRVAHVGVQIADALEYAHNHGVLHRDIKPSNLILDTDGIVWITDFGLANDGRDDLTKTGDIVGTLRYMAPERFNGDADVRSEVYSLGLTLYELCTLQHAFDHADRAQLIKQVTLQSPVSPRKIRPDIPLDLETVIAKAIAREPSHRYSSALHLANDLRRFVSDRPVLARRVSVFEKMYRWARRHPARAALVSCVALICLLMTGGSLYVAELENRHKLELVKENTQVKLEKSNAEDAQKEAEQATIQADIQRKNAERSALGSRAHLYWSDLEKADAIRASGKQGQNFASLASIQSAAQTASRLGLNAERIELRHVNLRSVAIAAMAQWDVSPVHRWKTDPGWTTQVAVDFKNQRVAQSDQAGNIAIRQFGNQNFEFQLPSPGEQAWIPMFSPNGRYFVARHHHPVSKSNAVTCLWDADTKQEIIRLDRVALEAFHTFSSDSSMLAVCRIGNLIEIYSTETGKIKFSFKTTKLPTHMHFARHDTQLIVAEREIDTINFWKLTDSPEILKSVSIELESTVETKDSVKSHVTALDWNDHLEHLAIAIRNDIWVWPPGDLDNEPVRLADHDNRVVELALHPTGKALMSSSWDGTTRLFDLSTNTQVIRVEGLRLTNGGFDETGSQIGFASKNDEFGIWLLPRERPFKTLTSTNEYGSTGSAKFVPGYSELIAFPTKDGIEIWDQVRQTLVGLAPIGNTVNVFFSKSSRQLYSSGEDGVRRWNYLVNLDGQQIGMTIDESSAQTIVDDATGYFKLNEPRHLLATKTKSHFATLIDLETKEIRHVGPHVNLARFEFTPDGRQLITATWQGNGIKIWNAKTGEFVKEISAHSSTASICINGTKDTLSVVTGRARSEWSMKDWSMISQRPRANRDGWPGDSAYSPDGNLLVATYSRYVPQLVDSQSGNTVALLEAPTKFAFNSAQWSQDGRFLSMMDNKRIQVWDIAQIRRRLHEMGLDWQN